MLRLRFQPHTRGTPFRRFLASFWFALLLGAVCAGQAQAGFIGDYALGNFTLSNTNGDGFAITGQNGAALMLTGPNDGTGLTGMTDLTIVAKGTGLVQFQYTYSTLDLWDTTDPTAKPNDFAGYLLGAMFTQLADQNGQSGTVSFPVSLGQSFGFRVVSEDNIGEPGILTVFNFNAPGSGASVPEPGTWPLLLVAGGAVLAGPRIRRAVAWKEEQA